MGWDAVLKRMQDLRVLIPASRLPLTWSTSLLLLPPQILASIHAFLNIRHAPRWVHLVLLPLTVLVTVWCHASVYFDQPGFNIYNQIFGVSAFLILVRVLDWSLVPLRPRAQSQRHPTTPRTLLTDWGDTISALCDLRGVVHTFGQRCHFRSYPSETRAAFLADRAKSLLFNFLTLDCLRTLVRFFGPLGTPEGRSIFLPHLSPLPRFALSLFLTLSIGGAIFSYIATLHCLLSLLLVGLFQQDPNRWPPMFDRPWLASSLADFWARRWHQLFRRQFVVCSWPGRAGGGDTGAVLTAFLGSGVLHEAGMRCMGRGGATWQTVGFFLLQGLGCAAEHVFTSLSGRKVRGPMGRVWTWAWLLLWGQALADAFAVRGTAGGTLYPEWMSPSEQVLNGFGVYTR
ncbi:hypothetical protein CALVIDRAFT_522468 [Calocera viscosa TUFC12733]|uniref:Wax synthase domain-containing protein n=1 Tax=Calocera viscosa (strain TUFC12733) TaxID=1330018 RepID=A0A167GMC2_CALVF|nr:hypothetical protein CALVIDRAFT_522468 [Calocera viscosa TUFC12733]